MVKKTHNLVITRPFNQADSLVRLLNQYSPSDTKLSISHLPLVQIKEVQIKQSKANKIETTLFNGVIFISPNAVNYSVSQLSTEQWKNLIKMPLYAVGSSTAETLKKISKGCVIQTPNQMNSQMNSEGLLKLPELSNVTDENWLIVKGIGGREKLKDTLVDRGALVTDLCIYERLMPKLDIIKQIVLQIKNDAIWIITSVHAIKNLDYILKQFYLIQNCRVIVSSDRIKESAIKLGFKVLAVAKNATDQPLMNCIRELKL